MNAAALRMVVGIVLPALVLSFGISGDAHAQKEFLIQGTIDCGRASGARCEIGDTITVWTTDVSGERQKVTIDVSWIKNQLDQYDQDDLIYIDVRVMPDGTLQGLAISPTGGADDTKRRVKEDDEAKKDDPTPAPTPTPQSSSAPRLTDLRLEKDGNVGFNLPPEDCSQSLCFEWTLTVTNEGTETATNVSVSERPDRFSFLTDEEVASQGTYDYGTNVWTVGTLAPGQTETLVLYGFWPERPLTENCAEIRTASPTDVDSTPNNGASGEDDQTCATIELAA
jgi:hypothetical protein